MTTIFITRWYHIFVQPFFFIRKGINKDVKALAPQCTGKVLDFGCGAKPYLGYFGHADEYTGLDIEHSGHPHLNEHIDVFYDGKKSPLQIKVLIVYSAPKYLNTFLI